jgi:hypothetical protein
VAAADRMAGRAGVPVTAAAGVRLALEPGRGRTAVPVRAALAGAALSVLAVAAALTFGASLLHLVNTPPLYGKRWDAAIDVQFPAPAITAAATERRPVELGAVRPRPGHPGGSHHAPLAGTAHGAHSDPHRQRGGVLAGPGNRPAQPSERTALRVAPSQGTQLSRDALCDPGSPPNGSSSMPWVCTNKAARTGHSVPLSPGGLVIAGEHILGDMRAVNLRSVTRIRHRE